MKANKAAKKLVEHIENGKEKSKFKESNGMTCIYCNCNNPLLMTIDHKDPKVRGGKDDYKNYQTCCFICNQLKGPLKHEEYLEYLKALKILYKLRKIKLELKQFDISFDARRHPGWTPDNREKKKENLWDK